jgi:hypothetical protein
VTLADQIINQGPYAGGERNPIGFGVDRAELNELRDELMAARARLSASQSDGNGPAVGRDTPDSPGAIHDTVTTYEEWRVTGTYVEDLPITGTFHLAIFSGKNLTDPQREARAWLAAAPEVEPFADGPHLHKRTVTVTDWEAQT